ncbi:hypothetical protein ACSHT2_22985 [Bradyrhizobium sp. PUT101]|uniref:hypothetical protein n=1 Tax=unclassified Bradyrhizobium TaxID=2631580 RepID=UPI0029B2352C|nr:hypothetical protein [Bradyrhizobium sp.]MDX3970983.1 hypothetical protein [Bradyrhizobium sp.]
MNHSIYSADRATHSKIVIVALLLAAVVAGGAVSFHADTRTAAVERAAVFKPGKPVVLGGSAAVAVR